MRKTFAQLLQLYMEQNAAIVLVTADMGFGMWDSVRSRLPDRFFNVGAAEQAGAGICVGLALGGKVPVYYSITPFLLWRPAELWRNYLAHEGIGVKLVGSGRDADYSHDGFTHWAGDDRTLLACWPTLVGYWPEQPEDLAALLPRFLFGSGPAYLNLKR